MSYIQHEIVASLTDIKYELRKTKRELELVTVITFVGLIVIAIILVLLFILVFLSS